MKIDFEKIDDVNGLITINVVEDDYASQVKAELKKIGKTHSEPGFRAGHVPAGVIAKKYGAAVKYDTITKAVGDELYKYITENNLPVLGNAIPDKDNNLDPSQSNFTLKFRLGLAPKMDIKADKSLTIPYYKIDITDEMIDRQDEGMRKQMGKQVPGEEVDETALVKGVITELNPDGSIKEDGIVVENGIVAPHYFKSAEQKELFIGKKVGDEVVFNPWATCNGNPAELSSMLNIDKKDTENYKDNFRMDIKEIIVLKPAELGEEFYKETFGENGGVTDEASYREALKKMIESQLASDENYRFTLDSKDAIVEKVKDSVLPDEILKEYLVMQHDDITPENVDEVYNGMKRQLLWDLAKEALAVELGIEVSDEDMLNTAKMMARQQFAQYGMANASDEAVNRFAEDILKDKKALDRIKANTFDMKFFNNLKSAVTLDQKVVSVKEFEQLFKGDSAEATEA